MHEQISLDQRVSVLEEELAALKKRLEVAVPVDGASWIETIAGSMKEFPEFDEVARLGAEIRRADQTDDDA